MRQPESTDQLDSHAPPTSRMPLHSFTVNNFVVWSLIVVFMGCLFVPPIYQFYYDAHVLGWWEVFDLFWKPPTSDNLKDFEKELIDRSRIGRWLRNEIGMSHGINLRSTLPLPVIQGANGFLFLREEFEFYRGYSLLDPLPAPTANLVHAIEDYDRQLRERGIRLVVLPAPLKTSIYPELIWSEYTAAEGPAYPPSYQEFLSRLGQDGVDVLDVSQALWSAKNVYPQPLFVKDDTHWSWRGRGIAADVLAEHLKPMLAGCGQIQFDIVKADADESHDLRRFGGDAFDAGDDDPATHSLGGVYLNGKPLVAGDEAPVLLLGDSYAEIGLSTGTSLAHDLMKRLQMGVQMIAWPGAGMSGGRQQLQERPSALARKKVVVWEFAARFMWESPCPDVPLPPVVK